MTVLRKVLKSGFLKRQEERGGVESTHIKNPVDICQDQEPRKKRRGEPVASHLLVVF